MGLVMATLVMGLLATAAPMPVAPNRLKSPPLSTAAPLPRDQDLLSTARPGAGGRLELTVEGRRRTLTVDPLLQRKLEAILKDYQTPYGAVVAMDPQTGRVLAMAEHSEADLSMRGLCTKAVFPAASIFKIVTASALLASGVKPDASECFHGGKRRLTQKLLAESPRGERCISFAEALAKSTNVVFAKLTAKYLTAERLVAEARAFRFNTPIVFPVPTQPSLASIPSDSFGLSSAGAGFGDVYMSPLHGASIAATVANLGVWRSPILFEESGEPAPATDRVMPASDAETLIDMLEQTVTRGTARRVFGERGHRVTGAVGKTGSLADRKPYRDYTWFVGFAPRDAPKVAVAAVVVNDYKWRIRATWLGREAMRLYLAGLKR